jgi:hypothetical protein
MVTFSVSGSAPLIVVLRDFQGDGKDGSMGLKVYWYRGFDTLDVFPSGVIILTVCSEMTSGGGTLLVAQSQ